MRTLQPLELGLVAVVLIAAIWDVRRGIIPNWLTYGAALLALAVNGWGAEVWWFGLAGAGIAFGIWFTLFVTGGIGGGDVKLMTVVGAVWGIHGALIVSLYAICCGFVMAVAWSLFQGRLWERVVRCYQTVMVSAMTKSCAGQVDESPAEAFPFAVAIALAVSAFAIELMLGISLVPGWMV